MNNKSTESIQNYMASKLPKGRWLAILLLTIGVILIVYFGSRAFRQFQIHQKQGEVPFTAESLRDWMTISYIAHFYRVPEEKIWQALKIPAEDNHEINLAELIDKYQLDPQETRMKIADVILEHAPHLKAKPPKPPKPPKP